MASEPTRGGSSAGSGGFRPSEIVPDGPDDRPGRWFVFDDRTRLLLVDGRPLRAGGVPSGVVDVHLLGYDDEGPVRVGRLAGRAPHTLGAAPPPDDGGDDRGDDASPLAGAEPVDLRRAFTVLDEAEWVLAGRAAQVLTWDGDHRFCSRCGSSTERHSRQRARVCGSCGLMAFPRLTPAVITLVERDDGRALLAWGRQFPGRFFSALAGFVEPGETLEQTVAREVEEEVGITVTDIRYFGSQPWPFPHSLMIGFNASYAGGDLVLQEDEIVEAGWFRHDELPPAPRGRMSIAGWLIEDWIRRSTAR